MARTPRTTQPPRERMTPRAAALSAERRAELVTTADVEIIVPMESVAQTDIASQQVSVLLWGREVPNLVHDLQKTVRTDCGGKSIIGMLEDHLDGIVERIMNGAEAADGRDPGRAEGIALALAVFFNPYKPSIDDVRQAAMDRYDAAGHDEE
jgi:hypothetical protein